METNLWIYKKGENKMVKIDIEKLEEQRKKHAFSKDELKEIVKKVPLNSKLEKYLYDIFLESSKSDDLSYIYMPFLSKITDIPLYKITATIPKTKKMFLETERLVLTNMRGVGYKVAAAKEATEEMGKSMGRGLGHMTNFYKMMEMSEYDWRDLKKAFPQHYELFIRIETTASHMKLFYQAHKQAFEQINDCRKLISKLRADVSQPEFYLEAQTKMELN